MWKKICLCIFSFVCLCMFYNTFESDVLNANSTAYHAGGDVTGRVNIAPTGISGSNIGMKKGDKILLETKAPMNGEDFAFQIIKNTGSSWLALSSQPLDRVSVFYDGMIYENNAIANGMISNYSSTPVAKKILLFNEELAKSDKDMKLIAQRDLTVLDEMLNATNFGMLKYYFTNVKNGQELGKVVFNPCFHELFKSGAGGVLLNGWLIAGADLTFSENYWDIESQVSGSIKQWMMIDASTGTWAWVDNKNPYPIHAIRPAAFIDTSTVVFAMENGTEEKISSVSESSIKNTYTSLYDETRLIGNMKVRIKDNALNAVLTNIQNDVANLITEVAQDNKVYLNATANADSFADGVNTVSVLVFQHNDVTGNDDFKYYKPLEAAKGNGTYAFDTTGMPLGKYKIAIVNEVYNETSTAPADSSSISDVKDLEIVSPLSNLSFTPKSDLKYGVNVNASDMIGTISSSNGAGTPSYVLSADSAHASDVTKFELGNDGKTIQVKNSALDAGTYSFKIQAQDENGHPDTPLEISATISVAKGEITSVAFDQASETKKSIGNAQTSWNETATATPNEGVKVSYQIDSGNLNLLDIDADTGAITMKTTSGFGKVVIKATADDDPTSGKDNVNPKSVSKDIIIYQEVQGSFTPDRASSDPTEPTFSASDANVKGNGVIGSIVGTQGTPDNLTSGTITYSYTLKNEADANYFVLSGSTLKVKDSVDLGVGSYMVKITVADHFGSKDVSVNINVGVAVAEKLDFYDLSDTIITNKGLSIPYATKNINILAKGVNPTNTNPITYSIEDGSTDIITVHPSSGALSIHGVGTTKVKATKAGLSGQAEASQTMSVTITKGEQNDFKFVDYAGSDVQLPTKVDGSYEEYKDPTTNKLVPYTKRGSFKLHTSGANGDVSYALKADSEQDVITVDNDGTLHIINATMKTKVNRVSVTATSIDTSGTYADKRIEIVVNIEQGEQSLSFVDQPVMIPHGNNVSVMPRFNSQTIENEDGSVLNTAIYLDQASIVYTNGNANVQVDRNDGVSLKSSYTGSSGVDGTIEAIKDGNRNYKQVKVKGSFHIMDPSENDFTISYPNEVIYGETFSFTPRGDGTSTNVVYQITANQPTIADFDPSTKKASAKQVGKATFTIKRTADGEVDKEKTVEIHVQSKQLEIKIDEKERYVGEENPTFTYEDFQSQLISWNGVKDEIVASDIVLTTTATTTSPKGDYVISANGSDLTKKYKNYAFNFQDAKIIIHQDSVDKTSYALLIDDGKETPYDGTWTKHDIVFRSKHRDYTFVSKDNTEWKETQLTINKEGSISYDFWMKKASGALATSITETIKIDKKAPTLKKIEATSSNNALEDIINKITFGYFFKPGTMFTIYTDDANGDVEVSNTKQVDYTIQKLQNDGSYKDVENTKGKQSVSVENESASIKISNTSGTYRVCVTPSDYANNQGNEECRDVKLAYPGVNESSDGDELPDLNIDLNDDGIPDLNITKNPGDKKPWVNIDINGDGKPEMNLDRDGDRIPYLNTGVVMKWVSDKKVDINEDGIYDYRTSTTLRGVNNLDKDGDLSPDLNIDFDLDGLPELNINTDGTFEKPTIEIDGNGDGEADINLDGNQDGKPEKNIVEIKEWKPEHDVKENGKVKYDTMLIENPEGKKELEDNNIVVEQPNGTFLPNFALKVDVITTSIEQDVKDEIIGKANGQVIKEVYEVELMKDGIQVQPDGRLKIKIPLPKGIISPHLIIELADGSYRKINAEVIDDYLVYESDFLGKVIVVGNGDVVSLPEEEHTPNSGGGIQPTVKGEYTPFSGANTGDSTSMLLYFAGCIGAIGIVFFLFKMKMMEKDCM